MVGLKNKAFTLVELIIVITILSILATLGFVSFQGYTKDARNSTKITTLKNLENGIKGFQTKSGILPSPDNAKMIQTGSLWQAGILGDTATKLIGINKKPTDPDTGVEYTYSTYGNTYEIATAISKSSSIGYTPTTYAASEELKAKIEGSFNGYIVKYSSGGLNYYMTTPSITLSNPNVNLSVGVSTTGVVINGGNNLPYTYAGVATNKVQNTTLFTPSILYAGSSCGPETYEEIVGLVNNLKQSLLGSTVDMTELNALKTNTDKLNFGLKLINEIGGCQIKEPIAPDIFPLGCGISPVETGDFEGYPNNYDLTNSCFVSKVGVGIAQVRTGIGSGSTKGVYLKPTSGSIALVYNVSSKIPFKLSFDANFFLDAGYPYSSFKFMINNVPFVLKGNSENGLGYKNYTSPLLPAGEYAFSIGTNAASYQLQDYIYIDNLKIICQGLGGTCGRTEGFEDGPSLIGDNFSFEGFSPIPWNRVTGTATSEGNYGIITPPLLVGGQQTDIIYKKTLTSTGYVSFDYKLILYGSTMEFYVDDVRFEHWARRSDGTSTNMSNFATFTSGLISPGPHTFRVRIGKGWHDGHTAIAYLDNFKTTYCTSTSVPNCGWTDGFEDGGTQNAYEQFTFNGAVKTAWARVTGTGASSGTYGIISPELQNTSSTTSIEFTRNFTQPGYLLFDYKAISNSGNNFKFYVDGVLKNTWDLTGNLDTYATHTSALLPTGNHTFRIDVFRNWHDGHYIRLYLDNIKVQY